VEAEIREGRHDGTILTMRTEYGMVFLTVTAGPTPVRMVLTPAKARVVAEILATAADSALE
jgi:hypothetical protein